MISKTITVSQNIENLMLNLNHHEKLQKLFFNDSTSMYADKSRIVIQYSTKCEILGTLECICDYKKIASENTTVG